MNFRKLKIFCALLLLPGCSLSPDYERPKTAASSAAQYMNNDRSSETGAEEGVHHKQWWAAYNDETLNSLVEVLEKQNLDLIVAAERIQQARSGATIAGADYWPQIGASSSRSRVKSPGNNGSRFSDFSLGDSYTTSYDATLSASWQLDLFGKISEARKSAVAIADAAAFDTEALRQSLIAELLNLRVSIATLQRRLALTEQMIENGRQVLDVVKLRYEAGASDLSVLDLERQREANAILEAQLPQIRSGLKDEFFKLDILLAAAPGTYEARLSNTFSSIPPPRDFTLPPPASLLDERPDLRAHELRLIAANADIGVAIADLYPGFSISGGYGFQSGVLDDLLRSDQIAWNIVSSVTARLFEGGRLRSNIKLQKSEARELAATYAKTVLEALREVEISLVQERETRNEFRAVQDRAYAAWTASRFAKKRYETGLLSLKEYLDVERNALDADIVLALAEQAMWQSRIAIHLALGGDWHKHETLEN